MTDRPTPEDLFKTWLYQQYGSVWHEWDQVILNTVKAAYIAGYTAHMAERHGDG